MSSGKPVTGSEETTGRTHKRAFSNQQSAFSRKDKGMITLFVTLYTFDKTIVANRVRIDVSTTDELKQAIKDLKIHIAKTFNTFPEALKTIIEI